jgi:protein O-GlcNAc transferase
MNRKDRRTAKSQGSSGVIHNIFSDALRHHQAGRLAEAEPLYRQILMIDPQHADTLHLLGVMAHQVGRLDVAVELIGKAIQLKNDVPAFHNNLGTTLQDQGKLDDAAASYKRALALNPDYAEAHINLGNAYKEQNNFDDAIVHYRRALALKPDFAETHNNLGTVLKTLEKFDEAIECYRRAIALKPDYAEAYNNLGNVFWLQGNLDEALTHYQRAIDLNPDYPETHNSMGTILKFRGRFEEALASYQHAIVLRPDYAEAYFNMGSLLMERRQYSDAIKCFLRAIALKPDYAEAHINLGQSYRAEDKIDDAITEFKSALAIKPDSIEALGSLGSANMVHGKIDEGMEYFRQAIAINPNSVMIYNNLLFAMIYAASVSPQQLAALSREFGEKLADPLLRQRPLIRNPDPERKLRIGYVSPDFRQHAVNYFFESLLRLHDRQKFEIFAYSGVNHEDAVTARLKQKFDHWRNILTLNDDEAADLIETDEIDILVDLAGHTGGSRLPVFARKPAPVQVTWLGYPATTGMKAIDYRITDVHAEPPGMTEHLNAETLWRLPEIFCCYQAHENGPNVIDHPPFDDNGYITFGCFNNFTKVTDVVMETWARILAQVPESRLLLEIRGLDSPQFRAVTESRMRNSGLPLDRIILEPRKKANQFVLSNRIDLALDPFPCNGGTTSMDTLWMGVPFVTLAGEHFVSRMGVTILTNAGMPELIAKNTDEYVELAVKLGLDRDRLRGLRHNLRQKVAASPLMNQVTFARNMEAAYREMWRKWCAHALS